MMNWQPGDLALCVSSKWIHARDCGNKHPEVRQGGIYTVKHLRVVKETSYLFFVDLKSGYKTSGFVKVTPGTEIQGAEKENRLPVKVVA